MTVTFLSNYINHHQIPFSNALYELLGGEYCFVQTQPMEQERLEMGWSAAGEALPYVHALYQEEELCRKRILESDVLLAGWSGREDLVQKRLNAGKLTIRVSERLYREGQWKAVSPKGLIHKYLEHTRYRKKSAYLLCAGAYVPSDFALIHAYPGKMFRWGYFPETRYDSGGLLWQKKAESKRVELVWAGRFIPLKHPEYMLKLAKSLKENKPENAGNYHIHMIGSGSMEEELKQTAVKYGVEGDMTFHGFKKPEEVRDIMESCHIHIFTSSYLEGWGAVVNEAMNSGLAVVGNVQAGAVPYLICPGGNGMIFDGGNYAGMEEQVRFLMENPEERERMGRAAYETITGLWNAEHAAAELLRVMQGLQQGELLPAKEGPMSLAPVVLPRRMYRFTKENAGRRSR